MNIVELSGAELCLFLDHIRELSGDCDSLKVAIDPIDSALKMKADNGVWSAPMGWVVQ